MIGSTLKAKELHRVSEISHRVKIVVYMSVALKFWHCELVSIYLKIYIELYLIL